MWFEFPQLHGLGRSPTARRYAISGLDEARAYLAHPLLGPRLAQCSSALLGLAAGASAVGVLGSVDTLKLRSCMTLFARAAPHEPLFGRVLERFYDGETDAATDGLLSVG